VVVALPARRCGLQAAAGVVAYLAGESAAQCGPCRNGLPALAGHLDALARGRSGARTVQELRRLSDVVDGRGACRHPDGTARFVRSTLQTFADEVEHHLAGRCTAPDEPTDATRRLPWLPS
jgi:NADH:ubiquinone oxidoreductase subunit F (NADH-binding)